jgi:hypothetical protein
MVCVMDATQAWRVGLTQSSCVTRTAPGNSWVHRLCQWPGGESRQPGMMMIGTMVGCCSAASKLKEIGLCASMLKTQTTDFLFVYI